jgi:hypothetical protein
MKKSGAIIGLMLIFSPVAFADTLSLTSALVNSSAAGVVDPTAPGTPGLSGNLNPITGLGTITFTDKTAGVGFFDLFVDLALATPFFNEYGVTGGGSLSAGQTWQIDVPDYWCNTTACQSLGLPFGTPDPNDPGANIIANTLENSLNDLNGVPGTLDNFLNACGAEPNALNPAQNPLCNNDVSLAMGFKYFLSAGSEEVITLTVSQTAPTSGFFLEQLRPTDPGSPNGTSPVFLYGSAQQVATPEPCDAASDPGDRDVRRSVPGKATACGAEKTKTKSVIGLNVIGATIIPRVGQDLLKSTPARISPRIPGACSCRKTLRKLGSMSFV